MGDTGSPLFQIAVHCVGIKCQGGNLHILGGKGIQNILGILVILDHTGHIDMADTGIAPLCLALGPAGNFHALEAQTGHHIQHFFHGPAI